MSGVFFPKSIFLPKGRDLLNLYVLTLALIPTAFLVPKVQFLGTRVIFEYSRPTKMLKILKNQKQSYVFGVILNDLLKVHVLTQNFDLNLPTSEINKWVIVQNQDDAEFVED